jgi:hypothetical protein
MGVGGRLFEARRLLALLAIVALGLNASACGGTSGSHAKTSASAQQIFRHLEGDVDDDETGEERANDAGDRDSDFDNDRNENSAYYDSDDSAVRMYGYAPSPQEKQALASLVERYYAAAAAAGDGAKACSLITPSFTRAIPEDYGQGNGPAYLHGNSCAVVMSLLFKHDHEELSAPITVTGVRTSGGEALVLVGSMAMPASYVILERTHGSWGIMGVLGHALP